MNRGYKLAYKDLQNVESFRTAAMIVDSVSESRWDENTCEPWGWQLPVNATYLPLLAEQSQGTGGNTLDILGRAFFLMRRDI